jgi:hypothetical protein
VHEDRDPVLSQGENARFRDAAIAYFSQKGISTTAVSGTRIDGVHAAYLSTQWPSALVGSAFLHTKDAVYSVFLVLTDSDGKAIPALASYDRWKDVEDGTDSE